jgi:hypothetical protein
LAEVQHQLGADHGQQPAEADGVTLEGQRQACPHQVVEGGEVGEDVGEERDGGAGVEVVAVGGRPAGDGLHGLPARSLRVDPVDQPREFAADFVDELDGEGGERGRGAGGEQSPQDGPAVGGGKDRVDSIHAGNLPSSENCRIHSNTKRQGI